MLQRKICGVRLTQRNVPSICKWAKRLIVFMIGIAVFATIIVAILVTIFQKYPCSKPKLIDMSLRNRKKFACVLFQGRLANQMFQYAFLYTFAMKKGMSIIIPETDLYRVFGIEKRMADYGFDESHCRCLPITEDKWDCAFDTSLDSMVGSNDLCFQGYFQSWKYWKPYEAELRKIFVFQNSIKKKALSVMNDILVNTKTSYNAYVLVGIHVRRGDHLLSSDVRFGKYTAPKTYLFNAMEYFRTRYRNVFFIAISDDSKWTLEAFKDRKDVYVVTGNTGEVDMCLLTMTNHTIMTVGTFGWFIGWLTNGTTIYYKNVAAPGSGYEKEFGQGIHEHFTQGGLA